MLICLREDRCLEALLEKGRQPACRRRVARKWCFFGLPDKTEIGVSIAEGGNRKAAMCWYQLIFPKPLEQGVRSQHRFSPVVSGRRLACNDCPHLLLIPIGQAWSKVQQPVDKRSFYPVQPGKIPRNMSVWAGHDG